MISHVYMTRANSTFSDYNESVFSIKIHLVFSKKKIILFHKGKVDFVEVCCAIWSLFLRMSEMQVRLFINGITLQSCAPIIFNENHLFMYIEMSVPP